MALVYLLSENKPVDFFLSFFAAFFSFAVIAGAFLLSLLLFLPLLIVFTPKGLMGDLSDDTLQRGSTDPVQ